MRTLLAVLLALPLLATPHSARASNNASAGDLPADASISDDAPRRDRQGRVFERFGFHAQLQIGPAYGQQAIRVEHIDARTVAGGGSAEHQETAAGWGLATRLELWPAYGRYGGAGFYGEGHAGAARRGGGATGVFAGSGGIIVMAGVPAAKLMVVLGRARRAGAFGAGTNVSADGAGLDADASITAGAEDIRSYRAGLGVRTAFGPSDRRGLDLWLLFDEPVRSAAVGVPNLGDAAIMTRGALWFRNMLVVSAEVTLRGAELESRVAGTSITERTAMLTIGWSMDRFKAY